MEFREDQKDQILEEINKLTKPYGLRAEYLDASSVVVQGDARTYTPAIVLIGPHPGDSKLEEISSMITNQTPVNRVTLELAIRHSPLKPSSTIEWE